MTLFARQPSEQPPARVLSRPGENSRLTVNELGHAVGEDAGGQTFNHPFRPFLSGKRIGFSLGSVQSFAGPEPIEPKIDRNGSLLPMSGKTGGSMTLLQLDASVANAEGKSWAALEVNPDANGELQPDSLVQIIHTNAPVSVTASRGLCAIAQILWSKGTPVAALPIVFFNLRYLRVLPKAGASGAPKHYFL